ncbi:MAG: ATP-dependent DNA helicase RecG [Oscillospiraceae bacterium]|nr:ATP-dependent DNA helicase RecG [Oscillospiraceae bacterium]
MAGLTQKSVQYLKGVGEKRAGFYRKLGVETTLDLLYHFPRGYIDLSAPYRVGEAPVFEPCAVRAVLNYKSGEQRIRGGLSIFRLLASDHTGELELTIFNAKYTVERLELDTEYIFYGKLTGSLLRREMSSPDIYPAVTSTRILPVYPQTAGLSSRAIAANVSQMSQDIAEIPDAIPPAMREEEDLPELAVALRDIHFPPDQDSANAARRRFIFEELLTLSCALETSRMAHRKAKIQPMEPVDFTALFSSLPFSPTGAQLSCIATAGADMTGDVPMNRIIQGDVGSGKTLVALACAYMAAKNSRQSTVMVPTAILAEQHYTTMSKMLAPFGMRVELLTGSVQAARRRKILAELKAGEIDLLVGTHALLSDGVEFARLGLVVTDEQHRFGVAQRAKLSQKNESAHLLVMSATPIPRTLSLIIYGDLSLSVLDEKPPGRQPIETLLIDGGKRARAMGFVRQNLDEGRQAYIVCPLIEAGELADNLRPATEYAADLSDGELRGYRVGLLHGKMKAKDKEDTMRRFKAGEIQVLVSTTVVEVGVDVPGATIIMIENAERFGLSQLHQLRGRVGRGTDKSWCILVTDSKDPVTLRRLEVMKAESDGFKIAEEDLSIRGPGDFFGRRQHGLPTLKVADLADDISIMQRAQAQAKALLTRDFALALPEHQALAERVGNLLHSVGERPN